MTFNPRDYRPSFMKGVPEAKKNRKCLMCPTILSDWQQHYCSGMCMNEAKERGIYGKENLNASGFV